MKNAIVIRDEEFREFAFDLFLNFSHVENSGLDSRPFAIFGVRQNEADAFRRHFGGRKADYDAKHKCLLVTSSTLANYFASLVICERDYIAHVYFGDTGFVIELTTNYINV